MSAVTVESSRFGTLEIEEGATIEFPTGLIGLGGRRWAVVSKDPNEPFAWLHSLEDPALALPITNPWGFFADYEVELSDTDSDRVEAGDVTVWGHRPGRLGARGLQREPPRADPHLRRPGLPGAQRGVARSGARRAVPRGQG